MEIASNLTRYMSMSGYDASHSGHVSLRLAQRMAAVETDALVARRNTLGDGRDPALVRRTEAAVDERSNASRGQASTDARADSRTEARDPRQTESSATNDPASPVFMIEYQGKHRVLKVNDSKGVLIYQVPSKGQLQLIQAEDNKARMERNVEAFA